MRFPGGSSGELARSDPPGETPAAAPAPAKPAQRGRAIGWVDLALVGVTLIWAVNFSVIKATLAHVPPLAFNAIRLAGATLLLLALSLREPRRRISGSDRTRLIGLGILGHTVYQFCFIFGLAATTAGHSALLLGLTPVAVALIGAASRIERASRKSWMGIGLSVLGLYWVLSGERAIGTSRLGDFLVVVATVCWSAYTVGSKPLIERYGPLTVTAYTMLAGSVLFIPFGIPELLGLAFSEIPPAAWVGTLYSLVFGLAAAYALWYYAVSRVGPTRTAAYSNLTPVTGILVSWIALGESMRPLQLAGVAVTISGIYLVRRSRVEPGGR